MIKKKSKKLGRPLGTIRGTKYPVKWPAIGITAEQDARFSEAATVAGKSKADFTRDVLDRNAPKKKEAGK